MTEFEESYISLVKNIANTGDVHPQPMHSMNESGEVRVEMIALPHGEHMLHGKNAFLNNSHWAFGVDRYSDDRKGSVFTFVVVQPENEPHFYAYKYGSPERENILVKLSSQDRWYVETEKIYKYVSE